MRKYQQFEERELENNVRMAEIIFGKWKEFAKKRKLARKNYEILSVHTNFRLAQKYINEWYENWEDSVFQRSAAPMVEK